MKKLVLAALFVAATLPGIPPAQAACNPWNPANPQCWVPQGADAAAIQGSGTISPGLGAVPEPQAVEFTGTATVVGTDGVLATYGCEFSGNDINGSVAEGVGFVAGSCGPIALDLCTFVRVLGVVVVICPDGIVEVGGAVCVFTPDDVLPTTSYDLVCGAGYANIGG